MTRVVVFFCLAAFLSGCVSVRTLDDFTSDANDMQEVVRFVNMPFDRSRLYLESKYERCYAQPHLVYRIVSAGGPNITLLVLNEEHLQILYDIRRHAYTTERTIFVVVDVLPDGAGTSLISRGPTRLAANNVGKFLTDIINNNGLGMC